MFLLQMWEGKFYNRCKEKMFKKMKYFFNLAEIFLRVVLVLASSSLALR